MFLVNVPIGLVLVALAARHCLRDRGERGRRLDLPGVVTLSLAVLLLVVPLVLGHEEHWPVWGWVSLAASAVRSPAFVAVERRRGARRFAAGVGPCTSGAGA